MRRVLALALLCVALLTACAPDSRIGVGTGSHIQAAFDAAGIYLQEQTPGATYDLVLEAIEGDYARAKATPAAGGTPQYIFLRQDSETQIWEVVAAGETIAPDLYQQFSIPPDVQLPVSQSDRG